MRYAGLWKRFIAYSIDVLLLQLLALVAFWLFGDSDQLTQELYAILQLATQDAMLAQERLYGLMFSAEALAFTFGLPAAYNILFVASFWQATPGKRWYGLKVVTTAGSRVSLPVATLRHVSCALSWIPCGWGYLLPAFHKEKAALHDLIAGTRVTFKEQ